MAGIRLAGLNSGMDTESIISQLVSAKKVSVNSIKKSQIKLSWKVDAWKSMNSKIYNLYTGTIDKMRWDTAYMKKKSVLSDTSLMDVTAGANAPDGTQTVSVESLAKAGYLTGGKLTTTTGGDVTADTKVSDVIGSNMIGETITIGKKGDAEPKTITITDSMTMKDLASALASEGINASFDATQDRLFISSKASGDKNDFVIGGSDAVLKALRLKADDEADADGYGPSRIPGSDAVMYLNGAKFTSETNAITVNGSTYTLKAVSDKDSEGKLKEATITTSNDYDGIYDTVKNFIKKYNELIKEMDKMYNADSAKGYEPLLSEEKDALTDSEINDWEKKIKDSLLRKDSQLGNTINVLTTAMASGVEVNGKKMYLADFGIATLGYFNAEENERHMYHIDGDADDANSSSSTDKLKSMIASDPETVQAFFTNLASKLYDDMTTSMERVEGFKSKYKVYNDKQMDKELSTYKTKIADAEEALTKYEDKWYEKFGAMESALGKLSSKQTAVSALLGGMG